MLLVGLTGGIGAGKSTVSQLLAERGAVVVDADQIARDLQRPGSPVLERMAERFGDHIVGADRALDRAAVAQIVFGDDAETRQALLDLNAIVHPAMKAEIERQIAVQAGTDRIVVLDFPLLGENPRDDVAATIVVDVPAEVAVERLVEFRGMAETDARKRIASQISRVDRLALATYVIDNSHGLDRLGTDVDDLWHQLVELNLDSSSDAIISPPSKSPDGTKPNRS
ncbi:MAG: dephospho-CoA kinase [Ilumatobacteraceae bacterium]